MNPRRTPARPAAVDDTAAGRRRWLRRTLAASAGLWLAGCAAPGRGHAGLPVVVDLANGSTTSLESFADQMRQHDLVLLGEVHDNPLHHRWRGECLALALRGAPAQLGFVAEHLMRGQRATAGGPAVLTPQTAGGPAVLTALTAAGFEPAGWSWPLHEPLFTPLLAAGQAVAGGNIPREQARQIAREGERAVPDELKAVLAASPMSEAGRLALDEALVQGHCGMAMPPPRQEAMRWAQRSRDAAMWLALEEARRGGARCGVLLCGNGHVRLDHGVGQIARALRPGLRLMAVGFLETMDEARLSSYTHAVITDAATREDPCRGLRPRA